MSVHRLSGEAAAVVVFCVGLPGPGRVAYEAGPTGFGLARALLAAGVGCVVAAAGKIERPAQDRVKTDVRDSERLVRLLMIDALHPVRVPSGEEEALRDLVRAREDLRGDLMRARHRLGKLLLRHDVRYHGEGDNWTHRHRDWLSKVRLQEPAAQATLLDYLGAIDALIIRRDHVEATIAELVPASPWAQDIARLRCLRGIETLTAVGLCSEIGDFHRFDRPSRLMSYLGLVPSEFSTGDRRRQGQITRPLRIPARPPAVGRSRLALPPPTAARGQTRTPPARPARRRDRDRLEDPTTPTPAMAAVRQTQQAQNNRRGRRRPPPRRILLGDHHPHRPHHLTQPTTHNARLRRRRKPAWPPRARAPANAA
jgi:transposase